VRRLFMFCSRKRTKVFLSPISFFWIGICRRYPCREVLQCLKQHQELRRIPVLVFSASEADRNIHAAYDNHANGFIAKPGGDEALSATVEAIERFWIALSLPKVQR
jgi:hypothetical protein